MMRHSSKTYDISVIIPIFNDWARLDLCLNALKRQTFAADRFEVLVIDNEGAPARYPADLPPHWRMLREDKPGSYAARNKGLACANGNVLAFTDSDCIPDAEWLDRAWTLSEDHDFQPRLAGPIEVFREEGGSNNAYLHDRVLAFRTVESARDGMAVTANLFVPRAVMNTIGWFDDGHFSGGDTEWNRRAKDAGVPLVYDQKLLVAHPARRSLSQLAAKRRRVIGGRRNLGLPDTARALLQRAIPPTRQMKDRTIRELGFADKLRVFLIIWYLRLVEAVELLLVRLRIKSPERS